MDEFVATLEELEEEVWPDPNFDSYLVETCQELRRKSIEAFTFEDLRLMIGQDIGLKYLVSKAIAILQREPLAQGDYYPGDLLSAVVNSDLESCDQSPVFISSLIAVCEKVLADEELAVEDPELTSTLQRFIDKYSENSASD